MAAAVPRRPRPGLPAGPAEGYRRLPPRGELRRGSQTSARSLDDLVAVDRGSVSREIFVSDEIYRRELERVFARAWLFVGHESQIPRPGDFIASSMGEESVILCRDRAGRLHVFLNSCRHRGMKVCRYDEGNTVEFHVPVPRLELRDRRRAGRRALRQGRLRRAARPLALGPDRGPAAGELQGHGVGDVGSRRRRRSSTTSAATRSTSTCSSTPGTAARAAPRSSAGSTSG